jgi:hypothetical protein
MELGRAGRRQNVYSPCQGIAINRGNIHAGNTILLRATSPHPYLSPNMLHPRTPRCVHCVSVHPWRAALDHLLPDTPLRLDGERTRDLELLGLVLVSIGIGGLVWVFSVLFAQFPKLPETVELDEGERLLSATSRVLVTHGPFAFSRNPMFLSGLIVLVGWAVFYGSALILIFAVVGWVFANYIKVPPEEHGLEARFGEFYRDYQKKVPRWIGVVQREKRK